MAHDESERLEEVIDSKAKNEIKLKEDEDVVTPIQGHISSEEHIQTKPKQKSP
jgi:hypothetical protein